MDWKEAKFKIQCFGVTFMLESKLLTSWNLELTNANSSGTQRKAPTTKYSVYNLGDNMVYINRTMLLSKYQIVGQGSTTLQEELSPLMGN